MSNYLRKKEIDSMVEVANVIICLRATSQMGGVSANYILQALNPEYVPGLFSFSVIISLINIEYRSQHFISVSLLDPEKKEVASIGKTELPSKPIKPSNLPEEYIGVNVSMDWNNINFKCSGDYSLVIKYDDQEIMTKKIFVKGKNEE